MLDLVAIKAQLEQRLKELNERLHDIDHQLSEPGDDDFEEMATEAENDETLEGFAHFTEDEAKEIALAIERIDMGQYGTCMACGGEIGAKRLEALVFATRCIHCAE